MEERTTIPYIVHEGTMVRMERQIKRITVALIVTVILMFVSNALWLYAWTQYDYTSTQSVDIDGKQGNANYVENGGSIVNGTDTDNKSSDQKKKVR